MDVLGLGVASAVPEDLAVVNLVLGIPRVSQFDPVHLSESL